MHDRPGGLAVPDEVDAAVLKRMSRTLFVACEVDCPGAWAASERMMEGRDVNGERRWHHRVRLQYNDTLDEARERERLRLWKAWRDPRDGAAGSRDAE